MVVEHTVAPMWDRRGFFLAHLLGFGTARASLEEEALQLSGLSGNFLWSLAHRGVFFGRFPNWIVPAEALREAALQTKCAPQIP